MVYLVHIYNRFYRCCICVWEYWFVTHSPGYRIESNIFNTTFCFILYSFNIFTYVQTQVTEPTTEKKFSPRNILVGCLKTLLKYFNNAIWRGQISGNRQTKWPQ